jgi:hypothetical protein
MTDRFMVFALSRHGSHQTHHKLRGIGPCWAWVGEEEVKEVVEIEVA